MDNTDKITYFHDQCLRDTLKDSYAALEQWHNSLQPWEYDCIRANLNTHFLPSNTDPTVAPIQWDWVSAIDFPNVNWVCRALGICPGPITILCAFVNTGKTLLAADLAVCVANGIPLFGEIEIQAPGKVLHLDFESGNTLSKVYYQRILNGHGITNFHNISFFSPNWRLDQEVARAELTKVLAGHKLCIIDCLAAGTPNTKQNEESARGPIDMLNQVSEETGCAIVLLHHEPKVTGDDPLRSVKGSGGIIAAAGNSLHLKRDYGASECSLARGKKRLGKDYKVTYRKEDVGEYVPQIDDAMGCKFVVCQEAVDNPHTMIQQLLNLMQNAPGINKRALLHQSAGSTETKEQALLDMGKQNLYKTEAKGNSKQHFITDEGASWLAYHATGQDTL
jgi:AAA domain